MRISVYTSAELQAVITRLKEVDRELRLQVRQATKADAQPIWQAEVTERVHTRLEALVLGKTARVAVSDQNVQLQSARIGRALPGGLRPGDDFAGVEFGADRDAERTYTARSKTGAQFSVKRHTQRQLQRRIRAGRVVFPAVAASVPRLASLWVQTTIRVLHTAIGD